MDPVLKVWESPYLCFSGNPIAFNDLNGDDSKGPGDDKKKDPTLLEPVVVIGYIPKEGTKRININYLKPGYTKEDDIGKISTSMYQTFHRNSKSFPGGWYDTEDYEVTTFDLENGQVMAPWEWYSSLLGEENSGKIRGGFGGRNWNGYQVDDNGLLTGKPYLGPSVILNGFNPVKAFKSIKRASVFVNRLSKMLNSSKRVDILNSIKNPKLKSVVNDLIRLNKKPVGNGSAMDALRFENLTGQLVGGKSHLIKVSGYANALIKVLRQKLDSSDKKIASELFKDIMNVLKGN